MRRHEGSHGGWIGVAAAAAMAVLCPAPGRSEPAPWMKKDRPNELALTLIVHAACPGPRSDYERVARRAFGRARITRIEIAPEEPYLRVEIWCRELGALFPYTVHASYVRVARGRATPSALGPGYDAAGAGPYSEILDSEAAVIASALADHVAANFDL